jgi:hypothetical protein
MKKLIIILIAVIAVSCGNENEHKVQGVDTSAFQVGDTLVLDRNNAGAMTTIDKLMPEDSVIIVGFITSTDSIQESDLMQYIKRRIRRMPPTWFNGFEFEELHRISEEQYLFNISSGSYYKLHRETIKGEMYAIPMNISGVLYAEKTLLIWVEKGEVKSSFDGISQENKNDIFLIWKINITIKWGEIDWVEIRDYRGFSLDSII